MSNGNKRPYKQGKARRDKNSKISNDKGVIKGKSKVGRNPDYKDNGLLTSQISPNVVTDSKYDNDPKWYMNLDPIARDYASLPFSQALGLSPTTNVRNSKGSGFASNQAMTYQVPGVMTMHFIPTIGQNNGPTAAVNIAAQQLYTLIRRANSGRVNYDKTDVMMLILAMDSAYMLYEDLLRAYRTISTFNSVNRYYPQAILRALGFANNIQYQLSEFRGILDMFAYKLASVNIPDQLDLIKRHSWMCSNIYLDDDSAKAQSYIFIPQCLYIWTEGSDSAPTSLKTYTYHAQSGPTYYTLDNITALIDTVMNPILGSEDVGTITGDMLKAFGEAGMIKIKPVEDYAALVPVYSKEVLLQIRNSFCSLAVPQTGSSAPTGAITQQLNDLNAGPYLQQSWTCTPATDGTRRLSCMPLLNFIEEDTSPENVMVATRLISLNDNIQSGGTSKIYIYGTEFIVGSRIWYFAASAGVNTTSISIDQDVAYTTSSSASASTGMALQINMVTTFNNAPYLYIFTHNGDNITYWGNTANVCNYIYLDDSELQNLHEIATMSLFTVKDYKLTF